MSNSKFNSFSMKQFLQQLIRWPALITVARRCSDVEKPSRTQTLGFKKIVGNFRSAANTLRRYFKVSVSLRASQVTQTLQGQVVSQNNYPLKAALYVSPILLFCTRSLNSTPFSEYTMVEVICPMGFVFVWLCVNNLPVVPTPW